MRIRQLAGVALFDWNRYSNALRSRNPEWVGLCNRYEKLEASPDGTGVKCDWRFTSELHAPKVVRGLGRRLMRRALSDYPISLESSPRSSIVEGTPDVSFIIGHRGSQRLPHLLAVLQSIAAQCEARVECIVVEQSCAPEVDRQLPQWVRYVHTRLSDPEALYSRSWAFNVGARLARGRLLVLQDNDLLVPREYASQLMARYLQGFEVVNIKRFIFYLGQKETQRLFSTGARPIPAFSPEEVLQNAQGGGSIAIDKEVYFAIGGFDESFVGWGGEDMEFWDRAATRSVWPYGYMPLVHLWHEPQPGKRAIKGNGAHTAWLTEKRAAIPPQLRIEELKGREIGSLHYPSSVGR